MGECNVCRYVKLSWFDNHDRLARCKTSDRCHERASVFNGFYMNNYCTCLRINSEEVDKVGKLNVYFCSN